MAKRRMLSVEFLDQDKFLSLPDRAMLLYVYLETHADDEGFVSCGNRQMKLLSAGKRMLELLIEAGFVIRFDSGILLITDWLVHNTIRRDRSTRTAHLYERSLVGVNGSGRYYLLGAEEEVRDRITTEDVPFGNEPLRGCPNLYDIEEYCNFHHLNVDCCMFLSYYITNVWKGGTGPVEDWRELLRKWAEKGPLV